LLLHFTFSYPRGCVECWLAHCSITRWNMKELPGRWAPVPFVAFRTVTSPIIKPSLIAAYVLSFARSCPKLAQHSLLQGRSENGPVFLQNVKKRLLKGFGFGDSYEGVTVFTSLILIVASLTIFALILALGPTIEVPLQGHLANCREATELLESIVH